MLISKCAWSDSQPKILQKNRYETMARSGNILRTDYRVII
uniref:Uncharacterized protein n=1 Tax=Arundo donax TaxID=35708 RepID=A0A0A9ABA0_ARUDO